MTQSRYVDHVVLTNKHSGKRTHKVRAFVIHHMAAVWTGKYCAEYFASNNGKQASANYCIGYDGDVALNVDEDYRAWTSSSNWADQRAITFELSNSKMGHPWPVSDATIDKLIVMLAELHQRYGLKQCTYTGDTNGTLWRHDWFASTNCPGPYLGGKLSYIAEEVNKILQGGSAPKVKPSARKTDEQLADEVLAGKHGNGEERKRSLGSRYQAVQNIINQRLSGQQSAKKSEAQIVQEVIDGKHGNGEERKNKLRSMGYDPDRIQRLVNEKILGQPKIETLYLPASANSWRVYRPSGPYTVGHEIGFLAPSKFGGLSYTVKGNPVKDVYLIDTRDFGRVAIYASKGTGATIR